MTNSNSRQETAREFLRVASERVEESLHARGHFIYLARDYGLSWADISHETGLSVPTCRKLQGDYLDARRGVA